MLIIEFSYKDPNVVSEKYLLVLLDRKFDVCMSNNGKDTKHTRHIARRVNLVRNGENCKICKIGWCEGDLQLAYIVTRNVGEHDVTPRMIYIMVILDN